MVLKPKVFSHTCFLEEANLYPHVPILFMQLIYVFQINTQAYFYDEFKAFKDI